MIPKYWRCSHSPDGLCHLGTAPLVLALVPVGIRSQGRWRFKSASVSMTRHPKCCF